MNDRPTYLLHVGARLAEIDPPATRAEADRCLRALLVGRDAGTTGRVDELTYPGRRGLHAYATVARYRVDADGVSHAEALP